MRKYIVLFLMAWLTLSCSDFLKEYSQDLAKVKSYSDLDELLMGDGYWQLSALYEGEIMTQKESEPYLMALHLMSDETELYRFAEGDWLKNRDEFFGWMTWQRQVGRNYKNTATSTENKDWKELYTRINVVNQVIGDIDGQAAETEKEVAEKTRIKGEAHFLRALYYFTLVNMYARPYTPETAETEPGIPLKLTQQIEDKEFESAPLAEVYAAILDDLATARECLRQAPVKNHPYRADIVAAHLLSSRVFLFMQEWQQAYNHADSVIARKGQLLDLNAREGEDSDVLSRESVETVFSMGGHMLAPILHNRKSTTRSYPAWTISKNLVSLYGKENDGNDLRRGDEAHPGAYICLLNTIINNSKASPVWVFNKINGPNLYRNNGTVCGVGDFFLMRTAEAYLNGAEAAAHLEKPADAHRLLNTLRTHRVQNETADYGSGAELVKFIREERERELCLEGHRWFDLRRYMVDSRYAFTKSFAHYYVDYDADTPDGRYEIVQYVLEENDPAYTLALPKEVTDFQNTLPSVVRPDRPGQPYDIFGGIDLSEAGTADGYKAGLEVGKEDMEAGKEWKPTDKNDNFERYYNGDYNQTNDYYKAYKAAFEKGYKEGYPNDTAKEDGYAAGFLAARKDYASGDEKGEFWQKGLNEEYDGDLAVYRKAFEEGYGDAYKVWEDLVYAMAYKAVVMDYEAWQYGGPGYKKYNSSDFRKLHLPSGERTDYRYDFNDYYDEIGYELYGDEWDVLYGEW